MLIDDNCLEFSIDFFLPFFCGGKNLLIAQLLTCFTARSRVAIFKGAYYRYLLISSKSTMTCLYCPYRRNFPIQLAVYSSTFFSCTLCVSFLNKSSPDDKPTSFNADSILDFAASSDRCFRLPKFGRGGVLNAISFSATAAGAMVEFTAT